MKRSISVFAIVLPLLLLSGCVSVPNGPSVMVLPGTGKNFEQFRDDDVQCRQYSQYQIGGTDANQAAVDSEVRSAAVGTVIGALAGAAIGGRNGAGVGAGTGLLVGSMSGAGAAQSSSRATQQQYDNAYVQCMYTKGHQVPVARGVASTRQVSTGASIPPPPPHAGPPADALPPPPPGNPPPPPPGAPLR